MPEGGVALAANAACATQAMRWGRWAYGLQFHVEMTPATVPEWKAIPEYATSLEASLDRAAAVGLEEVVGAKLPRFAAATRRLERNLAGFAGSPDVK